MEEEEEGIKKSKYTKKTKRKKRRSEGRRRRKEMVLPSETDTHGWIKSQVPSDHVRLKNTRFP